MSHEKTIALDASGAEVIVRAGETVESAAERQARQHALTTTDGHVNVHGELTNVRVEHDARYSQYRRGSDAVR